MGHLQNGISAIDVTTVTPALSQSFFLLQLHGGEANEYTECKMALVYGSKPLITVLPVSYGITAGTLSHEKEEDVALRVANNQKKHNTHTASFNSHQISFFVPIMGVFLSKNLT